MSERRDTGPASADFVQPKNGPGPMKRFWRRIRKPMAESRFVKNTLASLLANALRVVYWTNPARKGSAEVEKLAAELSPGIVALWHGQHLLTPAFYPRGVRLSAMFSRSNDAELNARVFEKLGFEAVRGSGGRDPASHLDKGGARALITLKRILDRGNHVAMIADVAKACLLYTSDAADE